METDGRRRVQRRAARPEVIHSRRNSNIGLFSPIATRHEAYDEWHGGPAGGPNKRLNFNALGSAKTRVTAGPASHGGLSVLQGAIFPDFPRRKPDNDKRRKSPPVRYWIASVRISSVTDTTFSDDV